MPETNEPSPAPERMRLYAATRFIFPRNYSLRIFAVCFVAVHLPIITFGVIELLRGDLRLELALALLAATLVGTGIAIAGLNGLLQPLRLATRQLQKIQAGEAVDRLPGGGEDLAGQLLAAVGQAAKSTESRIDRLKGIAATDLLTGLRNRRGFDEAVQSALQAGSTGAIAIIDVDRFKQVNDSYGHQLGDRLLRGLADRIRDSVRSGDIGGRLGGDEFAIFFPGLAPENARDILDRVESSLARRPLATIDQQTVSVSCGLSFIRQPGREAIEAAIAEADDEMYAAKRNNRLSRQRAPSNSEKHDAERRTAES